MTKISFLLALNNRLSSLPPSDVEERLRFYSEMIEDRMEEGLSEEEAVTAIGSLDEIVSQILTDLPPEATPPKALKPKRKLRAWEILLLALGSPIWFSLSMAAIAVVISLYASLWSVIVSLWAGFASLVAVGIYALVVGIVTAIADSVIKGCALLGGGLVCLALSILFFIGCKAATKGTVLLTKRLALSLKNRFRKKEVAQ